MKLSDLVPSVFTDGDDPEVQITTKKYSQFPKVEGPGIEGVGLKDGQNVRFELTTDAIKVNPEPFRNAKGQFIGTPEELAGLENQRDVNNFFYKAINDIEAGDIDLDGYATEEQLARVNEASELRDDALDARITELEKPEFQLEGTLKWVDYTYSSDTIDALVYTVRVHTDRTKMSLNWDTIDDGRKDWSTLIDGSVGLEVDGNIYWATVEYVGEAGQSGRGKNFKIIEHNIPPAGEIADQSITGIWPNYLPAPAGTHVGPNPPLAPSEGATWYDTVRLELFVYAEGAWLPCSPLGARVEQGEVLQAQILSRVEAGEVQQQTLINKVAAIEGALGEHTFVFTSRNTNPRPGQFNLKDNQMQLTSTVSGATYIYLNDTDSNGNTIDFSRITQGDVLRIYSADGQVAELKITNGADGIYIIEKLGGDLDQLSELPYDFILLSSFDPAGLATIDYVDAQDDAKMGKAEANEVANSFRIKGSGGTYLSAANGELGLFHLKTPTDSTHAVNKEYVDQRLPFLWKWNPTDTFLVSNKSIYWSVNEASDRYEFYVAAKSVTGTYDFPEFEHERTDHFQIYFRDGEFLRVIARGDYHHIKRKAQGSVEFFWVFIKRENMQIWRPEIAVKDDLVNCHIGGYFL